MMRVTVCQFDNRPAIIDSSWAQLCEHVAGERSDFVLLPEMPFFRWLAASAEREDAAWSEAVRAHDSYFQRLAAIGAPSCLVTRPLSFEGQCANVAWLWQRNGAAQAVHTKYYLPNEPGYWEANWYQRGDGRFEPAERQGVKFGVQICTEMWFFNHARVYGKAGTDILCVPRATPHGSVDKWLSGGRTAAVVAGAFCLSSNLYNPPGSDANLGGLGWIIDPDGKVLATTAVDEPFVTVEIELNAAARAKSTYPRYVEE